MNYDDYQARMNAAYHARVPELIAENRKLKRVIAALLIAGTVQWLAFLLS